MRSVSFVPLLFLLMFPSHGQATVFEFSDDGSVTKYEASDYLANKRHFRFLKASHPQNYQGLVSKYSSLYGVDSGLVHAVIQTESAYIADAVSPKGAEGLMQLMPETAENYGVNDSLDAEENIKAGVHLLSDLIKKYDGDVQLVLAAYNAGEGAVKKYGGIPPYNETIEYIKKVETFMEETTPTIESQIETESHISAK